MTHYGIVIKFSNYSSNHPIPTNILDNDEGGYVCVSYRDKHASYMDIMTNMDECEIRCKIYDTVGNENIEYIDAYKIYPCGKR